MSKTDFLRHVILLENISAKHLFILVKLLIIFAVNSCLDLVSFPSKVGRILEKGTFFWVQCPMKISSFCGSLIGMERKKHQDH